MDIERFNDHISQGIALMTEQKYESAKKEFEAAIQIDVKSYDAYIHLGNTCANLGQFDDALAAFKNALVKVANGHLTLRICSAQNVLQEPCQEPMYLRKILLAIRLEIQHIRRLIRSKSTLVFLANTIKRQRRLRKSSRRIVLDMISLKTP